MILIIPSVPCILIPGNVCTWIYAIVLFEDWVDVGDVERVDVGTDLVIAGYALDGVVELYPVDAVLVPGDDGDCLWNRGLFCHVFDGQGFHVRKVV